MPNPIQFNPAFIFSSPALEKVFSETIRQMGGGNKKCQASSTQKQLSLIIAIGSIEVRAAKVGEDGRNCRGREKRTERKACLFEERDS